MTVQLRSLRYEAELNAQKFVDGARQVQQAAGAAGAAAAGLGNATEQADKKIVESAGALARLKRSLDPLEAAQAKAERDQRTLTRAREAGKITDDELAAAQDRLRQKLEATALAAAKAERAQRQAAAAGQPSLIGSSGRVDMDAYRKLVDQQDNATKSTGRLNQALQQSGMQINDVAAQVASGGNAFQALGLQVGQLLQVFGVWGGILGAGVAILGMYAATLWDTGDAAKTAKEAEEDYADALEFSRSIVETAEETQRRLNEEKRKAHLETAQSTLKLREETLALAEQEAVRARIGLTAAQAARDQRQGGSTAAAAGVVDVGFQLAEQRIANMLDLLPELRRKADEARTAVQNLTNPPDTWNDPAGDRRRREAEQEAERLRKAAEQEAERRQQLADKMGVEWDERTRLLDATRQGADAVTDLNRELAGEQAVREFLGVTTAQQALQMMEGNKQLAEQARQVRQVARDNYDLAQAIDKEKDAQKARDAALKDSAREAARERDRYAKEIERTSERIAKDVATNIYDGLTGKGGDILEWFKSLFKRIAVEALAANVILPITTQVVGSMPGMFGIQQPAGAQGTATGTAAGAPGAGGSSVGSIGQLGSLASSGSSMFSGMAASANAWGASTFGFSSGVAAAPSAAFVGPMPLATGSQAMASGSSAALGGTTMLGAIGGGLGGAGVGGMVGSLVGNATGSKFAGGASGALSGAAAGFMMGGPVGAAIGAIGGALMGALGTASKPSNMEGNASVDLSTGRTVVGGQEGKKRSDENRSAAKTAAEGFSQVGQMLADYSDRRLTGALQIAIGNRDGLRATVGDETREFKRNDAGSRDMSRFVVTALARQMGEDLPREVSTALKNADWSDIEKAVADIQFGGEFLDTLQALRGDFGLVDDATKSAKKEVRDLTDKIADFRSSTKRLGLDTAAADDATRSYVEGLVGLRQVAEPLSEVRSQVEAARARFAELPPLLRLVGIAADEAAKGFERFMQTVRTGFLESIERAIAQITGDPTYTFRDLLDAQRQRLDDAKAIGADISRVERLNALERQQFVEQLTAAQRATLLGLNDAAATLAVRIADVKAEIFGLIDAQVELAQDAATAARRAAQTYRALADAMADAIRDLRGGDLSTLTPAQQLAEQRSNFEQIAARARGGDQTALAELPQVAERFLQASRDYNASSAEYSADFARVMGVLADAQATSGQLADKADAAALVFDEQVRLLGLIRDAVASGNMEALAQHSQTLALFNAQHAESLGSLSSLLGGQTGEIVAGNERLASMLADFLHLTQQQRTDEANRAAEAARAAEAEAIARAQAAAEAAARAQAEADAARKRSEDSARINATGSRAASVRAADIGGTSNAEFVANMFRTVLGREAGASEMSHHVGIVNQTGDRDRLLMYFRQNQEAGNYLEGLRNQVRSLGGVPAFAVGGLHSGGLRLVGERGPELEATGAARIWSAQQTRAMLQTDGTAAETVAELRALREQSSREALELRRQVASLTAANDDLGRQVKRLASGLVSAGGRA